MLSPAGQHCGLGAIWEIAWEFSVTCGQVTLLTGEERVSVGDKGADHMWPTGVSIQLALPPPILLYLGGGQLNKPHPIPFCSQGRQRRAPHLVRERWLKLADVQGADQRDAVRGSPVSVPRVFA